MDVLVFGGTAEGRALVEWLSGLGCCSVVSCTATEYGGQLVEGLPRVESLVGPLEADAKERLVSQHDFACIVDATHPFATHVSHSVAQLAEAHGIPLVRLARDEQAYDGFTCVADVHEAARVVAQRSGNVLLTTGSKDLAVFVQALPDFAERLFVRVLPVVDSVAHARELGIPASHIVAMQGPFSFELNVAMLRQLGIATMVTKASGSAGGFDEKAQAALAAGAGLVVVRRPEGATDGLPYDQARAAIAELLGVQAADEAAAAEVAAGTEAAAEEATGAGAVGGKAAKQAAARRRVNLVGIGLGNPATMTIEAARAIDESDLLIGAARMLEPYEARPCRMLSLIKTGDIVDALRKGDARVASVLFSGDVGFYSGATALVERLAHAEGLEGLEIRAFPGISSVVCLCARLLMPWQDVHLVSAHGRACDVVAEVRGHAKTFLLTGGKRKARDVCRELAEAGLGSVAVHVGERLSYPDERITSGTADELAERDFHDLAVMLVENPRAPKVAPGELEAADVSGIRSRMQ